MHLRFLHATLVGLTLLAQSVGSLAFASKQATASSTQTAFTAPEWIRLNSTPEPVTLATNPGNTPTTSTKQDALLDQPVSFLAFASERATASSRTDYSRLVPKPIRSRINPGRTSPRASYMRGVLGRPGALTTNCSPVTNPQLRRLMVTANVGPFRVTGLKPAVNELKVIFATVKREKPALYSQLGTAGMLCVRKVRGGSNFSNHSWGTAIDLKINGKLDQRGDNRTQVGLKQLYPYFHNRGFYWGAEFPTEDSMHFEASKELIARWKRQGKI